MKIGVFSKKVGLNIDTIRYYEKIGLIKPTIVNSHRQYSNEDVDDINTIIKLKRNGFTLLEIKAMFDLSNEVDNGSNDVNNLFQLKEMFTEKYHDMVQREKQILEIKQVLKRAIGKLDSVLDGN
ncbi:MerR family transcriptional regulator [Bacillus sp. FJAT-49732]|uniref:MerR family transcriptional regulator n=1 Tax=Lederbergia citrisecunda TaxID=2833583 RepID=A0A942TQ98_9BACI|nr:MerR family transcriptional regulator [Lederbergia citrisecunda]